MDEIVYVKPCFVTPIESNVKLLLLKFFAQCILCIVTSGIYN